MAKNKQVTGTLKLLINAGQANPAPPVGTALGPKKVNIQEFCKQFNEVTKNKKGPVPVLMTIYADNSFTFITKNPPTSYLIAQAIGLSKGSKAPGRDFVGEINQEQIEKVAEIKREEMGVSLKSAMRTVEGTALSMGIKVKKGGA